MALLVAVSLVKFLLFIPTPGPKGTDLQVHSLEHWRRSIARSCIELAFDRALFLFYNTASVNLWLRSMGAHIGHNVSIGSGCAHLEPELLTLGGGVHVGIPSMTVTGFYTRDSTGHAVYRLGAVSIGEKALLGAFCVAMPGACIPQHTEIAALAVVQASDQNLLQNSTYMGRTRLQKIATLGAATTLKITLLEHLLYVFMAICQPTLVFLILIPCVYLPLYCIHRIDFDLNSTAAIILSPLVYLLYGGSVTLYLALLRRFIVLPRRKAHAFKKWSFEYWRWTFGLTLSQLNYMVVAAFFRGSPFMSLHLWLLGARIGRNVFIDAAIVPDPDLLTIDDDAVVEYQALPQCHILEPTNIITVDAVHIGPRSRVGARALTLPGFSLTNGAHLGVFEMGPKGFTKDGGGRPASVVAVSNPHSLVSLKFEKVSY